MLAQAAALQSECFGDAKARALGGVADGWAAAEEAGACPLGAHVTGRESRPSCQVYKYELVTPVNIECLFKG